MPTVAAEEPATRAAAMTVRAVQDSPPGRRRVNLINYTTHPSEIPGRNQVARARPGPWFTTAGGRGVCSPPGQGADGRWRPAGKAAGWTDDPAPGRDGRPGAAPTLGEAAAAPGAVLRHLGR